MKIRCGGSSWRIWGSGLGFSCCVYIYVCIFRVVEIIMSRIDDMVGTKYVKK